MNKKQEQTDTKILKNKQIAQDDLAKLKDDNTLRIDELEKNQSDYADQNSQKHNDARIMFRSEINHLRDDVSASQKNEIDQLKQFVQTATENVNSNNDNIYERYDAKIKKMKDICAQYFSKYEKHLINHQTIVADLEKQ